MKTQTWVSHKNNKLGDKGLETVHVHLYELSEKANLTYGNRNLNAMPGGLTSVGHKGHFWGDGNDLCLDLGDHTAVCICQNSGCVLGAGAPPMTKVMRKEARHTQRWDRASGVPLEILEHLPPLTRACLLYYFVLSPTPLTLRGAVPHHLFRRRS